ncbi:hypothetical protein [Bergeyella sp. RCAD1439]|uniref:hypothetical protein n=1 Tax=Bergeyella anatis TaxID=3113737 RepID=UPI002E195C40|nr:hypothetical protein [Bergeyella sp. RCAD1439]
MENKKLSKSSVGLLALCALALVGSLFVPLWVIYLEAPQYPEGLEMYLHADKISGDYKIINGLNHYIGMKEIHQDDFWEFRVMPYILGFFAAFALFTAWLRRPFALYVFTALFLLFGVAFMVDFYLWEYDYGHNLKPDAAIVVPGMTYQPPLLGYKQLLNFGAYSYPYTGGWLMVSVALIALVLSFFEFRKR